MIETFGDAATEDLFHGRATARVRHFPSTLVRVAIRKLDALNGAAILDDLRAPPGNRLEALRGELKGYHGIRINGQWRLIFRWQDGGAYGVQVTDYHE